MIRRHFIRLMSLAGAGSLQAAHAASNTAQTTAKYKIVGFSCITCAVGLDVMLQRQKGVVWANSSYQEASTTICFRPDLVSEARLLSSIADMGFTASKQA